MGYWKECISEAFDDAGILATKDQIGTVASWVEGAHDNHGMAHGYDVIASPYKSESEKLKKELADEKRKRICPECNGRGRIIINGPVHSSDSECSNCRGEGKVSP